MQHPTSFGSSFVSRITRVGACVLAVAACVAGCASSDAPDVGLESLKLTAVGPTKVIPGTSLELTGDSFVDKEWGASSLHLVGEANGAKVDLKLDTTFVDFGKMTAAIDASVLDSVGVSMLGQFEPGASRPPPSPARPCSPPPPR